MGVLGNCLDCINGVLPLGEGVGIYIALSVLGGWTGCSDLCGGVGSAVAPMGLVSTALASCGFGVAWIGGGW